MSSSTIIGPILVAPHHFPDLSVERALAEEFGIDLIAAHDRESFHSALPSADVVMMTPYARLDAGDFERMTKCRAVIRYGMGYDNIDTAAATRAGIPVSIVPAASVEEVASHAFAMGLALVRRLPQGHSAIAGDGWNGTIAYDTPRLSELVVGIVGMGRIGRTTANYYHAIGVTVRAYDPFIEFEAIPAAPLDEILTESDVVSLHVPLDADTRNLISAEVLQRMRPGAIVVNVSRGGLVDEAALAQALRSDRIGGAALDVFSEEPLPADHPLRGAPNLILTPHIAWRSNRSLGALREGAIHRARMALSGGQLPDVVNVLH